MTSRAAHEFIARSSDFYHKGITANGLEPRQFDDSYSIGYHQFNLDGIQRLWNAISPDQQLGLHHIHTQIVTKLQQTIAKKQKEAQAEPLAGRVEAVSSASSSSVSSATSSVLPSKPVVDTAAPPPSASAPLDMRTAFTVSVPLSLPAEASLAAAPSAVSSEISDERIGRLARQSRTFGVLEVRFNRAQAEMTRLHFAGRLPKGHKDVATTEEAIKNIKSLYMPDVSSEHFEDNFGAREGLINELEVKVKALEALAAPASASASASGSAPQKPAIDLKKLAGEREARVRLQTGRLKETTASGSAAAAAPAQDIREQFIAHKRKQDHTVMELNTRFHALKEELEELVKKDGNLLRGFNETGWAKATFEEFAETNFLIAPPGFVSKNTDEEIQAKLAEREELITQLKAQITAINLVVIADPLKPDHVTFAHWDGLASESEVLRGNLIKGIDVAFTNFNRQIFFQDKLEEAGQLQAEIGSLAKQARDIIDRAPLPIYNNEFLPVDQMKTALDKQSDLIIKLAQKWALLEVRVSEFVKNNVVQPQPKPRVSEAPASRPQAASRPRPAAAEPAAAPKLKPKSESKYSDSDEEPASRPAREPARRPAARPSARPVERSAAAAGKKPMSAADQFKALMAEKKALEAKAKKR